MSFIGFGREHDLKKSKSNIEVQQVLSSLSLNGVEIYFYETDLLNLI